MEKKKRMNSKKKGDNYERKIATFFNELFGYKEEDKDRFRRTPMSGGFSKEYPSDIITPEGFKFAIECKKRQAISLESFLGDEYKTTPLWKFWLQTKEQAEELNKKPMLIFSKNRSIDLVMIDLKAYYLLENVHLKQGYLEFCNRGIVIFRLDELKNIDKEFLMEGK